MTLFARGFIKPRTELSSEEQQPTSKRCSPDPIMEISFVFDKKSHEN